MASDQTLGVAALPPLLLLLATGGASTLPPLEATARLWQEIGAVKTMMAAISDELGRFNSLYLGKLEHRMVAMASALSSVDSNVKHLQERAHVWDTFQLHVSAWNDQIKTLDKKVDILSRGHEKLETLDAKVNSLLNLDYKLSRITDKLADVDEKVSTMSQTVVKGGGSPLFGDIATRGVVSTLKVIERKLDRIQMGYTAHSGRPKHHATTTPPASSSTDKLVIRCNAPVVVEELLRDVAAKVDVIFDKVVPPYDRDGDSASVAELRDFGDSRLWRRHSPSYKRAARALESLESSLALMMNRTTSAYERQATLSNSILSCCTDTQHHLSQLGNFQDVYCSGTVKDATPTEATETAVEGSGDVAEDDGPTPRWTSVRSCDLVSQEAGDGVVYRLGGSEVNAAGRDYYVRRCDTHTSGGGWTVIQRRGKGNTQGGHEDFSVSWEDYQNGFGDLYGEFWFGNNYIHRLTANDHMMLRVELESWDGKTAWAEYSHFRVASADHQYQLFVSGYNGNATDSLLAHNGSYFSTADKKNDEAPSCCPCAPSYGGGWWFYKCFESNLNGVYHLPGDHREPFRGIIWENWLGDNSLRSTEMKVRRHEDTHVIPVYISEDEVYDDVTPLDIPDDP